jgi:addiction module HigA family antidote
VAVHDHHGDHRTALANLKIARQLAIWFRDTRKPTNRVTESLKGARGISADTALRLARYFGTSARLWMNLQTSYDLAIAEQERGEAIADRVRPHAA